ncbi:MAG: hypothetical protein M0006_00140 [Magnetospirillum sp.]|nr:hypothetical protein [Magnetospirillum sp.]
MSQTPPDFKTLAGRYLDLWQDQMTAMATDPALADALAGGIAAMSQGVAALMQAAQAATQAAGGGAGGSWASDSGKADHERTPAKSSPSTSPRASAAPAASGGSCLDPADLAGRIAVLEERIAALEAELGRSGGGAGAKPRRRRA